MAANPHKVRFWVAGPRAWENPAPIRKAVGKLVGGYGIGRLLLMTGGAPGVDTLVEEICLDLGVHCFRCRAAWPVGRHAGPMRNAVIADEFGPRALIAFHYYALGGTDHKGTSNAIKQAQRRGIPVKTIRVAPHVALPSSVAPSSPMGNHARAEQGLPPKPPRQARKKAKRKA